MLLFNMCSEEKTGSPSANIKTFRESNYLIATSYFFEWCNWIHKNYLNQYCAPEIQCELQMQEIDVI